MVRLADVIGADGVPAVADARHAEQDIGWAAGSGEPVE
jgi:hypothetical protein